MNIELLRQLPKVDQVVSAIEADLVTELGYQVVVDKVREAIAVVRKRIIAGETIPAPEEVVLDLTYRLLQAARRPSLRRVINATGVILHTNLGRAQLSDAAKDQLWQVASSYSTLEYDLGAGRRGSRYSHVAELLCRITGAEAALVVNNNAAAVLLALSTLARGKEAIVSRGQLVEIGGAFRIPEVMEQSGAVLREVGTTNKTRISDYEQAVNENTAVILKVHTSNYRIVGFTEEVTTEELVELGRRYQIPVLEDLGSGVLIDTRQFGLSHEPTVLEVVAAGVDVITFSGDKLLGGPQAGIIVGKAEYIDEMKENPLTRALRIDKLTLAALEATLRLYLDEQVALERIPTLQMLRLTRQELLGRAEKLCRLIKPDLPEHAAVEIIETYTQVGGGSLPLERIPSAGVALTSSLYSANRIEHLLRTADVPVITRIEDERVICDLRTVKPAELELLAETLCGALGGTRR